MTDEVAEGAKGTEQKDAPLTLLEQLYSDDIIGPWIDKGLVPQVYEFNKTGHLVASRFVMNLSEAPWIYVSAPSDRRCSHLHNIEAVHGFIPKQCMACWKVVVVPKTLKQLFQLLSIQKAMVKENPYCWCKCGIETRPDVERNYGGYFYTNSIQEGLVRLEEVKANVLPVLGEDTTIILKRACTEYERKYGPSDKWDTLKTDVHKHIEERLERIITPGYEDVCNSPFMQKHTLVKWIRFAADRGDPTIPELNGGKKIFPGYVTYAKQVEVPDGQKTE